MSKHSKFMTQCSDEGFEHGNAANGSSLRDRNTKTDCLGLLDMAALLFFDKN